MIALALVQWSVAPPGDAEGRDNVDGDEPGEPALPPSDNFMALDEMERRLMYNEGDADAKGEDIPGKDEPAGEGADAADGDVPGYDRPEEEPANPTPKVNLGDMKKAIEPNNVKTVAAGDSPHKLHGGSHNHDPTNPHKSNHEGSGGHHNVGRNHPAHGHNAQTGHSGGNTGHRSSSPSHRSPSPTQTKENRRVQSHHMPGNRRSISPTRNRSPRLVRQESGKERKPGHKAAELKPGHA